MSTLCLRIAAPLMAFGERTAYPGVRHSAPDPTLSALQGLLAAAAGVGRTDRLPPSIAEVELAVRIERPGSTLVDFHTVTPAPRERYTRLDDRARRKLLTIRTADGTPDTRPVVTRRHYRADAEYVALITDPDHGHEHALRRPAWQLYAGRRTCALSWPLVLARYDTGLLETAHTLPSVTRPGETDRPARQLILFDTPSRAGVEGATRTERRNDRLVSTRPRRWAAQPRTYLTVHPPTTGSWLELLETSSASNGGR